MNIANPKHYGDIFPGNGERQYTAVSLLEA